MNGKRTIAYFSMEIGLDPALPTYAGGLGILAGDTIRAAADLRVPMVGVTLIHRRGYFRQRIDESGWQIEEPADWKVEEYLRELNYSCMVSIEGRDVQVRCWRYEVAGPTGHKVPVYFLDTNLPENSEWDRHLTDSLYGGDQRYRLCQEAILGIGGVRMLRALGYRDIDRFHMNEGHSSLLTLELLDEEALRNSRPAISMEDVPAVRNRCVFTSHTPVPEGHDQFPLDLVKKVLGRDDFVELNEVFCCGDKLNMTYLGLNLSRYINGVSKRHGEVSRQMFAGYTFEYVTNGIHPATWISASLQELYDRYITGWRTDGFSLRSALRIPKPELWDAHLQAKRQLMDYVNAETSAGMSADIFTIGFARRATAYKRWELLFQDEDRLERIAEAAGGLQIVFAGKAHPRDTQGKEIIRRIVGLETSFAKHIRIAYLANYDIRLAKLIVPGVDLWVNAPQPPLEASGTSGMKAAINGIPSLSVLDGWWIEGHIEGVTGWSIGRDVRTGETGDLEALKDDSESLYGKLELIMPMFYNERDRFIEVMQHAIAVNGSFFTTHRMLQEYILNAYFR